MSLPAASGVRRSIRCELRERSRPTVSLMAKRKTGRPSGDNASTNGMTWTAGWCKRKRRCVRLATLRIQSMEEEFLILDDDRRCAAANTADELCAARMTCVADAVRARREAWKAAHQQHTEAVPKISVWRSL